MTDELRHRLDALEQRMATHVAWAEANDERLTRIINRLADRVDELCADLRDELHQLENRIRA